MIRDRKSLTWILAATIAPLLLFIQKPFHIDDSAFLEVAQNILKHPVDPFHGAVALVDNDYHVFRLNGIEPNTFESMSHPPLIPYVMAGIIKLSGGVSEIPLHAVFMIFPVLAALSALSLAERFTNMSRLAVLLLVVSPIFMVNAQNLMTDVPMLAFVLSSIALFINGVDKQKVSLLILAGFFAGLAVLTRYVGFLIIPIFFAYSLLKQKGSKPALIAACSTFAVFAVWLLENLAIYGTAHLTASYSFYKHFYAQHRNINLVKTVCDFAALGGCSLLFAFLLAYIRKDGIKITQTSSLVAGLVLLVLLKTQTSYLAGYTFFRLAFLYLFVSFGLYFIAEAVRALSESFKSKEDSSVRSGDVLFLFIWLSLTLLSTLFLLPFGTARYMLPMLFPLILILAIGIDKSQIKINPRLVRIFIVGTFIGGLIISWADFEYALTYKIFARNIREMYPSERLWFVGEWGFRYYMKEQGAKYLLSNDTSPAAGDIIVKPGIAGLHEMQESVAKRCIKQDPYVVNTPNPVRVMNVVAKAGFYAHGYGLFPFSISNAPLEQFDVCKIMKNEAAEPLAKTLR